MKGIEPNKVPGEKPDTSVDDYFEPAKDLLQDHSKFLESLLEFDKVEYISRALLSYISMYCLIRTHCCPFSFAFEL